VAVTTAKRQVSLHFRVRPLLLRWLVGALCLVLTVLIVPHVFMSGEYRVLSWLIISAVFGLLMAFVKPLLQLLLLPLIFVSYGLVIVLINTIILWMLSWIFPARFHVEHIVWALLAGLVSGLLIGLFENLFGLSPPIVQGGPDALRREMARAKPGHLEGELLDAAVKGKEKMKEMTAKTDDDAPGEERP
jgi:putative membrane protein